MIADASVMSGHEFCDATVESPQDRGTVHQVSTMKYTDSSDVIEVMPQRPFPSWVQDRIKDARLRLGTADVSTTLKRKGQAAKHSPSSSNLTIALDFNNMRKDWKSRSTKSNEALQKARVVQNRKPEPIKDFPGNVRLLQIGSHCSATVYSDMEDSRSRKGYQQPAAKETTPSASKSAMDREVGNSNDMSSPSHLDPSYLALDESKLPIEVIFSFPNIHVGVLILLVCIYIFVQRLFVYFVTFLFPPDFR